LSWINWVRLALIPAGGDWRDLPKKGEPMPLALAPAPPVSSAFATTVLVSDALALDENAANAGQFKGRPGLMGVNDWNAPARTVNGSMKVTGGNSFASVADPRVEAPKHDTPAHTLTGESYPSDGGRSGVDSRLALAHTPQNTSFGVIGWEQPANAVRGAMTIRQAPAAVADPRVALTESPGRHENKYAVNAWTEPARTVIGATQPGSGGPAIADPRLPADLCTPLADGQARRSLFKRWHINAWTEPTGVVAGEGGNNGAYGVADRLARVSLACAPRAGAYGVISWDEAAYTVTGAAGIDNGPFAVGDPRFTDVKLINRKYPIIVAGDGTWHRPLTTLELAVLQGLPPTHDDGAPLVLAGANMARKRERIGNAVPVQAAQAIGESILTALLANKLGTWMLSSEGVWVERDTGRTEHEYVFIEEGHGHV
jgi:hypothetical protein